jgi:hypothetical protein
VPGLRLAACGRVAAAVLLLGAGVAGCGSGPTNSLEGTWSGRCALSSGQNTALTTRFDDNGRYSSSSTGSDGDTAGSYTVTGSDILTISNQASTHAYHYQVNNNALIFTAVVQGRSSGTCNLAKQQRRETQ